MLTEDDIIYGVVVKEPTFFESASALQYFNIQSDERRTAMLADTDYILVSRNAWSWYFLKYDPAERGLSDPFRAALHSLAPDAGSASTAVVYGHRLTPVVDDENWLVLKVERARG